LGRFGNFEGVPVEVHKTVISNNIAYTEYQKRTGGEGGNEGRECCVVCVNLIRTIESHFRILKGNDCSRGHITEGSLFTVPHSERRMKMYECESGDTTRGRKQIMVQKLGQKRSRRKQGVELNKRLEQFFTVAKLDQIISVVHN